jgi:outer membrane protein assembly factor BamB
MTPERRAGNVGATLLACIVTLAACCHSAGAGDGAPLVSELVEQLRTGGAAAQVAAADRLARMGEAAKPAVPVIFDTISGKSSWIDIAMAEALTQLAPVSLPFLLEKLKDRDTDTRLRALRGMMGMGVRLRNARPAILEAAADPNEDVRKSAQRVLQGLDAAATLATNALPASPVVPAAVSTVGETRPAARPGRTADWTGFRGPDRDGICTETGLLQEWPTNGPPLLWRIETVGNGISSVSIAGGRLYTTGDRGSKEDRAQFALAYDMDKRTELWATRIGDAYPEHGALSTPTLDGELLYVTSTDGGIFCMRTADGAIQWRKSFSNDFGGAMMSRWRWSESPLVDGDKVICTPGASNAMVVALEKRTGATIWKCAVPPLGERGRDGAGYCSAIAAEIGGTRQYVQVVGRGVIGVAADSGAFLWGYNRLASTTANIPGPIVRGDSVFTANGYNTGSALLRLERKDGAFKAGEVYVLPAATFQNHHGGYVLVGDYVYGGSGSNKGDPTCIEFATGKTMWRTAAPAGGSASVIYADGHVVFRYDRGLVVLVEANPSAFRVKGSFTPPRADSAAWAYPVVNDGKFFLRDQHLLMCYDIRAPATQRSPIRTERPVARKN